MKILVFGNESAWDELTGINKDIEWIRAGNIAAFFETNDASAYFNLSEESYLEDYTQTEKPVFINSVCKTLREMNAGKNIIRLNGWNGFLKRSCWEIAGNISEAHQHVLSVLQRKLVVTPDEPGFISARIISMIINEAFFAKEENISTESEIDIAMKLGTNYPYGPFEWAQEIGLKNIHELLASLSKNDIRYTASTLLQQKAKDQ